MQRRDFLKGAAVAAAAAASGRHRVCAGEAAQPDDAVQRPNVLFVLADQWRSSAFSHGSDPLVQTPNFDRLADQGARFTRAYASNPVCTPNRACILTGRFCHETGMIHNNLMLPPSERCLPEAFDEAGYATHYIGKWHMDGQDKPGFVPPGWRRRGLQTFEGFNRGHFYYKTPTFSDDGKPMNLDGYEPSRQTELAIDFMRRHRDRPFFCYLSWGPPHTPYRPPEGFDRFQPDKLQWRPNVPQELRESKTLQREMAGYFGLCESLDHEMGRLLKSLDELGLAENTLLVFTADHGDMHGSHGKFRKGKPENESLQVPLFIRWPKRVKKKQTPDTLLSSIDLMPTLLSMCGLKNPGTCTGRDLSTAVLGGTAPQVESVFAEGGVQRRQGKWRAIVTPRHKLVQTPEGGVSQLFDLERDPYELRNLAEEREHRPLRQKLLAELVGWGKRTGDPFPEVPVEARQMYSDAEAAAARS